MYVSWIWLWMCDVCDLVEIFLLKDLNRIYVKYNMFRVWNYFIINNNKCNINYRLKLCCKMVFFLGFGGLFFIIID